MCSTFSVFYFLSFSSVFLCISSTFSFSFCLFLYLPSTFFLAVFYLSPLTFFAYHLVFLSVCVSFFVFYFPSTFILCLSFIIFPLLFSLSFCAFLFFYYYYYHFYPLFFFSVFSTFQFFACLFCLFFHFFLSLLFFLLCYFFHSL